MGRKKTEITPAQMTKIGKLALNGCQNGTICALMDWDEGWLAQRPDILRFLRKKRAERKNTLRKAQTINATKHRNHTMQIFLGVNELKQKDTKTHEVEPRTIADIAAAMGIAANAASNRSDEADMG